MRRLPPLALPVALVVVALSPAAAQASCMLVAPLDAARSADVILTAIAQPGPTDPAGQLLSPAPFHVERREKGRSPRDVRVTTAVSKTADGHFQLVSVGIRPVAGERWRIFGARRADGTIEANECWHSVKLPAASPVPVVRLGDKRIELTPSGWLGAPRPREARMAALPLSAERFRTRATLAGLWLARDHRIVVTGERRRGAWTIPLAGARRGDRLVLDTGEGFFAAELRPVAGPPRPRGV